MSPPIRDGSGNSIGAIRLGDGSEISEVRTGAGDVLFSGVVEIPDSVQNQLDFWWPHVEDDSDSTILSETLSDSTENATINGATWKSDTDRYKEQFLSYSIDDYTEVDNQLNINEQQTSYCGWFNPNNIGNGERIFYVDEGNFDAGDTTAGYYLSNGFNSGELQHNHVDGTNVSEAGVLSGVSSDNFYFIGVSMDGDNSDLYLWDESAQVDTATGSASRPTGNAVTILWGVDIRNKGYFNGGVDAWGTVSGSVLSESDFESIWQDTKP